MGAYSFTDRWLCPDDKWMNFAACRDLTPEQRAAYFADDGRSLEAKRIVVEAKGRCLECMVRQDCLDYAMQTGMQGVWGATDTKERHAIRTRSQRELRRNGTYGGAADKERR